MDETCPLCTGGRGGARADAARRGQAKKQRELVENLDIVFQVRPPLSSISVDELMN